MKKLTFAFLTLICSAHALAGFGGKERLTLEKFEDIKRMEKVDAFRVYLDKKVSLYSNGTEIIIETKAKGKIIDEEIKHEEHYKQDKNGHYTIGPKTRHYLYVSFDKKCVKKSCAYQFQKEGSEFILTSTPLKNPKIVYGTYRFEDQRTVLEFSQHDFEEITRTKNYAPGFE